MQTNDFLMIPINNSKLDLHKYYNYFKWHNGTQLVHRATSRYFILLFASSFFFSFFFYENFISASFEQTLWFVVDDDAYLSLATLRYHCYWGKQ